MIISKNKMQKIAEEIGRSIKRNVNIMDEKGVIIASTDPERIGAEHEGAMRVIRDHLDQLSIEDAAGFYGARDGVNLPLQINGECVGVVGITGSVSEVGILGTVIKKMTEILILEECRESQKKSQDDMRNNFAIEWLFSETNRNLSENAELLGIRLDIPRVMAVTELKLTSAQLSLSAQEQYEKIANSMRKSLQENPQQFLLAMGSKIISFFAGSNQKEVEERVRRICLMLEQQYPCRVFSGVSTSASDVAGVKSTFHEAEMACSLARQLQKTVYLYNETDVQMLLSSIPKKYCHRFAQNVFAGCSPEQIREIVQCLQCYMDSNGSVTAAANSLYIHKNTLQYRLSKIKTVTGYDPRVVQESIPLYIAMYICEYMETDA